VLGLLRLLLQATAAVTAGAAGAAGAATAGAAGFAGAFFFACALSDRLKIAKVAKMAEIFSFIVNSLLIRDFRSLKGYHKQSLCQSIVPRGSAALFHGHFIN
jgi:hypothetical protein